MKKQQPGRTAERSPAGGAQKSSGTAGAAKRPNPKPLAAKAAAVPKPPRETEARALAPTGAELTAAAPGRAVMNRLLDQVNDRWERRSKDYEEAKKQFERAADAVRSAKSDDKSVKLRTDLQHHATEMRVQLARRAELDWVRQVLQHPAR